MGSHENYIIDTPCMMCKMREAKSFDSKGMVGVCYKCLYRAYGIWKTWRNDDMEFGRFLEKLVAGVDNE